MLSKQLANDGLALVAGTYSLSITFNFMKYLTEIHK